MLADITPKETDREGVRLLMRRGGQLIEVLPKEEYEKVHLPGAACIPLGMFSRMTADRLQWDKPVIVYSRSFLCDLSARAAWRLASLGFTQVFRYTGGKADWLANGLPLEGSQAGEVKAGDIADLDLPTCKRSEKVGEVRARVQPEGWNLCAVVNDQLVVLGILRPSDFEKADQNWPAEETMDRDPQAIRLDIPLETALEKMNAARSDYLLVTFPDGKLFGLLKRQDVEAELNS